MKEAKIKRIDLKRIVQLADNRYFDDIKKCIQIAKTDTVDIITNSGTLVAEQNDKDNNIELSVFVSKHDQQIIEKLDIEDLYQKLSSFLE